jgi:hypothetical protein
MAEPIIMKLGMYIIAPKFTSAAYFTNAFHKSVCLCVCVPLSLPSKGSVKHYRGNEYTHNKRRIGGRVFFYAICVESKK